MTDQPMSGIGATRGLLGGIYEFSACAVLFAKPWTARRNQSDNYMHEATSGATNANGYGSSTQFSTLFIHEVEGNG